MEEEISSHSLEQLFPNLKPLLSNPAPFREDWFDGSAFFTEIPHIPVLVVGAGGLGCEIVKNLAMSGVRDIHLVDMDTIDFTNLNRQFLFREKDIGKYKADVVADFVMRRCPGVKITTYKSKVQEIPFEEYTKFPVIVGGLDNVEARKYLNRIVFLLNQDSMDTQCYYLDGATEGFEGQALLVEAYKSSCYECSLFDGMAAKPKVNYCTIANKPRTPEHCIQYVLQKQWEDERNGELRDNDNLEHLNWIYQKALARAKEFDIEGVTPMLSLGVTKNVIPAIASTNALIAAVTCNQVFKILSGSNPHLNNYMLYKGGTFIGCQTQQMAKKPTCQACQTRENRLDKLSVKVSKNDKFGKIFEEIKNKFEYLGKPFVNHHGKMFLNPGDTERYEEKINSTISDLISEGRLKSEKGTLTFEVTDKCLKSELPVEVILSE